MKASTFALVLLVASGCAQDAAPERRCVAHAQCDTGFLCAPGGSCQPAMACTSDSGCCPGSVCFSGWCRPTPECFAGETCAGLGDICEVWGELSLAGAEGPLGDPTRTGLCAPSACDGLGACTEPFQCVAGRCLLDAPCDGRCAGNEVCDVASGRCLPPPASGPCICAGGWSVVSAVGGLTPLSCGPETYACSCVTLADVPAGLPGVDGRLIASAAASPDLISYEPRYGDLVLSHFVGDSRADQVLDGVPAAPANAAGSYRGGVLDPGPDVGGRPALAAAADGSGGFDVIYRDHDRQALLFGRYGPDGARLAGGSLPVSGREVGRYSCLTRRPDGRLVGLVFVSSDDSDSSALLVRLEARQPDPLESDAWAATTIVESALPLRAEQPCNDACGLGERCVLHAGAQTCANVVSFGVATGQGGCPAACGPHELCAEVDGGFACRREIIRRYDADRLPFGQGLFADCQSQGGQTYATWYDADRGQLVAARWPFSAADRVIVDGDPAVRGGDVGRFSSLALAPDGRLGIAYQDVSRGSLRFAEAPSWGAPFVIHDLPQDGGAEPGIGATALYLDGRPAVVHLDGASTSVELVAQGVDGTCWGRTTVLSAGFAYPSALPSGDGGVWVAAQALRFDDALQPRHAPQLRYALPTDCR